MSSLKIMRMSRDGMRRQRGNGLIGSAMGTLARVLRPFLTHGGRLLKPALKQVAKKLGSQALQVGTDVLSDVSLDNKGWKDSLKSRVKENMPKLKRAIKDGALEGGKNLARGLGDKTQFGQGRPSFKAEASSSKQPATAIFTFPAKKKKKKSSRKKSSIFD